MCLWDVAFQRVPAPKRGDFWPLLILVGTQWPPARTVPGSMERRASTVHKAVFTAQVHSQYERGSLTNWSELCDTLEVGSPDSFHSVDMIQSLASGHLHSTN